MAMKQCESGHVYDDTKNTNCPYCSGRINLGVARPFGESQQLGQPKAPAFPKTMPLAGMATDRETTDVPKFDLPNTSPPLSPVIPSAPSFTPSATSVDIGSSGNSGIMATSSMKATTALNAGETGIVPVVGWLICVDGEKKGKDFRICNGKNYVGRMRSNDICLDFDDTISKESNAIISFDDRNKKFFIQPGESKNNIYVNNELLLVPVQLKGNEIIELGRTKLFFHPLCDEKFNWKNFEKIVQTSN